MKIMYNTHGNLTPKDLNDMVRKKSFLLYHTAFNIGLIIIIVGIRRDIFPSLKSIGFFVIGYLMTCLIIDYIKQIVVIHRLEKKNPQIYDTISTTFEDDQIIFKFGAETRFIPYTWITWVGVLNDRIWHLSNEKGTLYIFKDKLNNQEQKELIKLLEEKCVNVPKDDFERVKNNFKIL